MEAICNFLPPPAGDRQIACHHFVYEADLCKLEQPFVNKSFHMHLVYKGEATLCTEGIRHRVTPGTLFITFPYQQYELIDDRNFTYLYITFDGPGAEDMLRQFGISKTRMVFKHFNHITDFWMTSIRRANPANILILTESVVLHTLSYIEQHDQKLSYHPSPQINAMVQYIRNNYADPELSISKLADIFCFSKKYLSAVFSKKMGINFTEYLAKIRIERATELLTKEKISVAELATRCGFSDSFYFSKVFKRITGVSPSKYETGATYPTGDHLGKSL